MKHAAWLLALMTLAAKAQMGERVRLDDAGGLEIDRTEVTIAQFARYVAATGTVTQAEREGGGFEYVAGWQRRPGWTWRRPDGVGPVSPHLPTVHLTHAEAAAYCRWAGGRLPTAAEWRRAAYTELRSAPPAPWVRGRSYPWPTGDSPQGANTSDPDPWPRAAPVTETRAGVNGLHDMGANVWEWAADVRGEERPTMGGSWWYPAGQMRADVDAWKPGDFYAVYIGMRCVYDVAARRGAEPGGSLHCKLKSGSGWLPSFGFGEPMTDILATSHRAVSRPAGGFTPAKRAPSLE